MKKLLLMFTMFCGFIVCAQVPADPSSTVSTAVSEAEIDVAWTDNSSDETGFKIERKEGTGAFVLITTTAVDVVFFSDTGLSPLTVYSYRVTATNGSGDSAATAESSAATDSAAGFTTQIIIPTGVDLVKGDTYGMSGGLAATIDGSGLSETLNIANVVSVSHITEGAAFSYPTSWVSGSLTEQIIELNLTATYHLSSLVVWGNADYLRTASRFTVEFSTDGGSSYSVTTDDITATKSFDDEKSVVLDFSEVKTANYIRLTITENAGATGLSGSGDSLLYEISEIRLLGALTTTLPLGPSAASVSVVSSSALDLTWTDNSDDETGFVVRRKAGSGAYSLVTTTSADVTSYSDTGLETSKVYTYKVTATKNGTESFEYTEASGATKTSSGTDIVIITPTGVTQLAGGVSNGGDFSYIIDGSGLSETPTTANVSFVTNANDGFENAWSYSRSWLSESAGTVNYFDDGFDNPKFELNLGDSYELTSLLVWGEDANNSRAATRFTVRFSTDGGQSYDVSTEDITATEAYIGTGIFIDFSAVKMANYLELTITENEGKTGLSAGNSQFVGMGEIRLIGVSTSATASVDGLDEGSLSILSPNPATDFIHISGIAEGSVLNIHNSLGVLIEVVTLDASGSIDISQLASGMYFITIVDSGSTFRFIKI